MQRMTSETLLTTHIPQTQRPAAAKQLTEWLAEEDYQPPRRGEIRAGEVLAIDGNSLLVDIGAKRDAIVPPDDLRYVDDEVLASLDVGDEVPVCVLKPVNAEGNLIASLSKGLEQQDWETAQTFMEDGTVFDSDVIGHNKGGVLVTFGRLQAFVPNSLVTDLRRGLSKTELAEAKAELVGRRLPLQIVEVNRPNRRLVASQRAAERARREQLMESLEPEQVRLGRVVSLVDFGAFIDLGGVDGLLHVSEMAWSHVTHPSEMLSVDQEVEVLVVEVDRERERVRLSLKRLPPKLSEA